MNSELCLPSLGLGLKRPYEDGAMDDKDLIKKMKRNLRKGTRRKEMKNNGRVSYPDCFLAFVFSLNLVLEEFSFQCCLEFLFFLKTTKIKWHHSHKWSSYIGLSADEPPLSLFFLSLSLSASLPPSLECRSIVLIANVLVGHPTIPSSFFIQVEDEPRLMEAERHFLGKWEGSDWKWWENRAAPVFIIKITSLCAENL